MNKKLIIFFLIILTISGCAFKNIKTHDDGACLEEEQARLIYPLIIYKNLGDLVEFRESSVINYQIEFFFIFNGINNYKHEDYHWAVVVDKSTCEAFFLPNMHVEGHLNDIWKKFKGSV